jgi:hypothetical protein
MIQRIQTIFLFLASVMAVGTNFLAFGIEWKNSNPDGIWLGTNTANTTNLILFFCIILTGGLSFLCRHFPIQKPSLTAKNNACGLSICINELGNNLLLDLL